MISLSFAAGPDPRVKVYVLSSTPDNAELIGEFIHDKGGAAITVFDEMCEFELLSDLGVFSAVIVGDFHPPSKEFMDWYIHPALNVIPKIVILTAYAPEDFRSELMERYGRKVILIDDLDHLAAALRQLPKRTNPLGLKVPLNVYMGVSGFVGLCSLILVFLGLGFLAARLLEAGKKPWTSGLPQGITYAVFTFTFTQIVYMVCSVLLAMPLGLHTSSPKVTAIGLLGFGGGSRPRMLAGLVGFLFGSLTAMREGLKYDRVGLIAFLVLVLFVVIDPLTNGVLFYEFIRLYTVGPMFESAQIAWSGVRRFFGYIGMTLGGWVSPVYALSTGIILYYAGAIPLLMFPKLGRSTATLLLLCCSFWAASGGIRVADMMPWKSVASSIPGIVVGLIFAVVFWAVSLMEDRIRAKVERLH